MPDPHVKSVCLVACGASVLLSLTLTAANRKAFAVAPPAPSVMHIKVPNNGLQPRVVTDAKGTLHLVYFSGDAAHGDLFYASAPGNHPDQFGIAVKVNSLASSACAIGTMRGAQLALGESGRLFAVWNGSDRVERNAGAPYLFTRSDVGRKTFERERDLLPAGQFIDGGGTVAASGHDVYVFWHSFDKGKDDRTGRVYMSVSHDDGAKFDVPKTIDMPGSGACGCCGMSATAKGNQIFVVYRSAVDDTARDATLLASKDGGKSFHSTRLSQWRSNTCPVTQFTSALGSNGGIAAWEQQGKIDYALLDKPGAIQTLPRDGVAERKYPAVACNADGTSLITTLKSHGWGNPSKPELFIVDRALKVIKSEEGDGKVPPWSFATPVALSDKHYVVIY